MYQDWKKFFNWLLSSRSLFHSYPPVLGASLPEHVCRTQEAHLKTIPRCEPMKIDRDAANYTHLPGWFNLACVG